MRYSTSTLPLRQALGTAVLAAAGIALATPPVAAQGNPDLPRLSPRARVEQQVGVAKFAVDYASPAVREREIWGGLVPYDTLWRTGADAPTTLEASHEFTFGGVAVPAGTYVLLTVPGAERWTVILNSNTEIQGTRGYQEADNIARVEVSPEAAPMRERLSFLFLDTKDENTQLALEWEELRVRVAIDVDTDAIALANIEAALAGAWRPHFESARYLVRTGGDLDLALDYIETSIRVQETWWNAWVKAQILAELDRKEEAVRSAKQAQQLGADDRIFRDFFATAVEDSIAQWEK